MRVHAPQRRRLSFHTLEGVARHVEPDLREPARCFQVGRAQFRGVAARRERDGHERGQVCRERRVAAPEGNEGWGTSFDSSATVNSKGDRKKHTSVKATKNLIDKFLKDQEI